MVDMNNAWSQYTEKMTGMFQEQMQQLASMNQEWSGVREQSLEQMHHNLEDYNNFMKASFEYQTNLLHEWQKMSMDAMRQTMETFKPGASDDN